MSLIHDIIKIKFVREGYLPNYPYHLISDAEMCDAFLHRDSNNQWQGYMLDKYPLPEDIPTDSQLYTSYYGVEESSNNNTGLLPAILQYLDAFKSAESDNPRLPNWIYSYMIDSTIGPKSEYLDLQDLFKLLNINSIDVAYTAQIAQACYDTSKQWLSKHSYDAQNRPPTIFGEPHVIKSLRLNQIDPKN